MKRVSIARLVRADFCAAIEVSSDRPAAPGRGEDRVVEEAVEQGRRAGHPSDAVGPSERNGITRRNRSEIFMSHSGDAIIAE